nr:MAG TPA: hypothetical protein [Caudoviricetes sp.]
MVTVGSTPTRTIACKSKLIYIYTFMPFRCFMCFSISI